MIYVCGDIHRNVDIHKLDVDVFPEQLLMDKSDFVIILGDFSLIWSNSSEELRWRKYLDDKPFTTAWLDGNHENFDYLEKYPTYMWNGGKVQFISDSIIHLKRGQIFEINGKKFFVLGGAKSIDKANRIPGVSWWPQEMPSAKEYAEANKNLDLCSWKVDYVLTHDCSMKMLSKLKELNMIRGKSANKLTYFLEGLENKLSFKHWYFGHFHNDQKLDDKHSVLFKYLLKIPD